MQTENFETQPGYRALFLSDVHLGARASQANQLLDFLRDYDAETIYLVGDIIDGWALKGGWYWPQTHNDVVQKILRKARKGSKVIYLPGNHDEFLRDYYGTHFGGIEVQETAIHVSATGKRYLVLHGDAFDFVIRHAKWLAHLGDAAYDLAIFFNRIATAIRRRMGLPYWSLSAWAKLKVKNAVNVISDFEEALVKEAARVDADGVICGRASLVSTCWPACELYSCTRRCVVAGSMRPPGLRMFIIKRPSVAAMAMLAKNSAKVRPASGPKSDNSPS
jgi:UDP-2,3-diacylglucosamine pyrophosphatase LpxH